MKKSIFLFFAAILCATSALAHDLASGQYVYFEKPSDWTQATLLLGHNTYSVGYNMTNISNTNLYYWKTDSWSGYYSYAFIDAKVTSSDWGGEGNGDSSKPDTRKKWAAHYSSTFTSVIAKYHLFNTTKSVSSHASDRKIAINRTQTIKVQLKDGSNWVDATVVPADLTASTYAMTTSSTAVSAASASLAKESATVSAAVDAAYSATVTLSCTNVADGYMFDGWYDEGGNKITSYTVSAAATVYARFTQSAEKTNLVTVSYMCGATDVAASETEQVGVETEKTFTAPTVTGYNFTGWTKGVGIVEKSSTENTITIVTKTGETDYTLVANYEEVLETVYFINTGKWSDVYIHLWNGTAAGTEWPGTQLTATGTKIGEYDVYEYTAQQGAHVNLLFHKKDNDSQKTADLTWTAGKYYIHNHNGKTGWYTQAEAEEILVVPVVEETVYFVNNKNWTKVQVHAWKDAANNGWPGQALTATGKQVAGFDVYSFTAAQGTYTNLLFNNKEGDAGVQSSNFVWTADKYYYMGAAADYAGGTEAEVETALAPDPLATNVYLVGGMNSWNTTANEFRLAVAGDATASVTVTLPVGETAFKVTVSGDWHGNNGTMTRNECTGWTFKTEDGDCKINADVAGEYIFTWHLADKKLTVAYPELPTYTVTATAENGTVTGAGEYKHGTEATLVATPNTGYAFVNWKKGEDVVSSEASYTFTVTANTDLVATFAPEETHEVTVSYLCNSNPIPGHDATTLAVGVTTPSTITAPAITNYKFDSWTVGTGVHAVDATANPIQITTLAEGEYTLVANYTKIELTYTVKVPEGTEKCYIAGDMNSWSFQEMTPTANANEFTITIDGATTAHKYKYTCGEGWAYVEKKADGSDLDADRTYNANDVVAKWADPLATNVYLAGSFTDWDNNKIQFKKATHDAKTATVTVELSEANTTYEFKIVNDGNWLGNTGTIVESINGWTFPNGDDNCEIKTTYAGYYTFTWNLEAADQQLSVAYPVPSVEDIIAPNMSKTEVNRGFGTPFTLLEDLVNYEYTFTIDNYKGGAFVYGSEFKITGDINGLSATGLGTWNVVDGIETLTAQLYAYDENGHYLYNVTATTGATTTTPIECMNATYTIDQEFNEVTITGIADSKDLTILVSPMFEGGYWAEGTWGDVTIYGESFEFDNSDLNEYYVGGTFIDDDNNVYDVVVFAYPDIKTVQITEGQNALTIAANNGKTVNAEVTRQFTAGNLYTIALPFTLENVSSVFGAQAYEYTSLAKDGEEVVLYFNKVNTLEAGKPYLIEPTQDVPGFTANNVTISNATNNIAFTAGKTTVTMIPVLSVAANAKTDGKYWLAADRYLYNNENDLPSLRALFEITTVSGMPPRARVALGENAATGLDNITNGENVVKTIVNGQLVITVDGVQYNAQGIKF